MEGALLWCFDLVLGWWRDRRKVRVRVHRGFFLPSSPEHFFINVTNRSRDRDIVATHVWFDTNPRVDIVDQDLPARLPYDQPWETAIPVDRIPPSAQRSAFWLARVKLSTDAVVRSRPRKDVPPVGAVPRAGQSQRWLASSIVTGASAIPGPVSADQGSHSLAMLEAGSQAIDTTWVATCDRGLLRAAGHILREIKQQLDLHPTATAVRINRIGPTQFDHRPRPDVAETMIQHRRDELGMLQERGAVTSWREDKEFYGSTQAFIVGVDRRAVEETLSAIHDLFAGHTGPITSFPR
jgi:hypothetical protein